MFTVCPFRNNLSYFIARLAEREGWVVRPGSGAGCNVMLGLGTTLTTLLHTPDSGHQHSFTIPPHSHTQFPGTGTAIFNHI